MHCRRLRCAPCRTLLAKIGPTEKVEISRARLRIFCSTPHMRLAPGLKAEVNNAVRKRDENRELRPECQDSYNKRYSIAKMKLWSQHSVLKMYCVDLTRNLKYEKPNYLFQKWGATFLVRKT